MFQQGIFKNTRNETLRCDWQLNVECIYDCLACPATAMCRHITLYTIHPLWATTTRDRSIVGISWRWRWKRQRKRNANKQNTVCTQQVHLTKHTTNTITNYKFWKRREKSTLQKQFVRSKSGDDTTRWDGLVDRLCWYVCVWNDMRFATALHNILYDTKQQQQQHTTKIKETETAQKS